MMRITGQNSKSKIWKDKMIWTLLLLTMLTLLLDNLNEHMVGKKRSYLIHAFF